MLKKSLHLLGSLSSPKKTLQKPRVVFFSRLLLGPKITRPGPKPSHGPTLWFRAIFGLKRNILFFRLGWTVAENNTQTDWIIYIYIIYSYLAIQCLIWRSWWLSQPIWKQNTMNTYGSKWSNHFPHIMGVEHGKDMKPPSIDISHLHSPTTRFCQSCQSTLWGLHAAWKSKNCYRLLNM